MMVHRFCKEQMHKHLMDLEALHDAPVAALKEAFVATDKEVCVRE